MSLFDELKKLSKTTKIGKGFSWGISFQAQSIHFSMLESNPNI